MEGHILMIEITSWNQNAIRFIDPPQFTWQPVKGAAAYEIQFAAADNHAVKNVTKESTFDFSTYWNQFPLGEVYWVVIAKDTNGKVFEQSKMQRFTKVPDFDGEIEVPENWEESALRNTTWLLAFSNPEEELPLLMRSSAVTLYESTIDYRTEGSQHEIVYPALHYPSYIFLFLEVSRRLPDTVLGARAHQLALFIGDWLISHTLNSDWKCSRFPISAWITGDISEEHIPERGCTTVFRAARVGEAMLSLYHSSGDARYFDYAEHLADTLVGMQNEDGSWPYRVNPETGDVVEEYTSSGILIAKFLDGMQQVGHRNSYQSAINKAIRWTLDHPVRTNRWQGMYEDVKEQPPYSNLENWDACEMIRFLCKYADEIPSAIDIAESINRFVEDQFVIFGPHVNHLACQTVYPTVMEQYIFYFPMEVHTGNWLMSLISLHQATKKEIYKIKSLRAANAITRMQHAEARYSTSGVDWRFGTHLDPSFADWYGCNAIAALSLLKCQDYFKTL